MSLLLGSCSWQNHQCVRAFFVSEGVNFRLTEGHRSTTLKPARMDMYSKRRNGQLPLGETGHLRYLEVALVVMMALFGAGCDREPEYVVGAWLCKAGVSSAEVEGGASAAATVSAPWSTGFEDGFCSYSALGGFCYSTGRASYEIVRSPVHSGHFAAAFTVDTSRPDGGRETDVQARCVRQGVLPREAYYSAWYLIPALAKNQGNWNFFHVQGESAPGHSARPLGCLCGERFEKGT